MKLLALIAVFLFCLPVFAQQQQRPPTNWEPIVTVVSDKGRVFIDKNSFTVDQSSSHKYVSAMILFVPDSPMNIKFNNRLLTVSSFVRGMMVSCNDKLMSPSIDLFFDVKMPERTNKALGGINYPGSAGTEPIEETSSIYKRFCDPYL